MQERQEKMVKAVWSDKVAAIFDLEWANDSTRAIDELRKIMTEEERIVADWKLAVEKIYDAVAILRNVYYNIHRIDSALRHEGVDIDKLLGECERVADALQELAIELERPIVRLQAGD